MLSRLAEDLLYLWPPMKCETKCPLNSLKVETVLGAILLKHTLASSLSVVGKAMHMISSGTPYRCMSVLNDFRWSSRSFDPSYASTYASRTWLEGEKRWPVLWRVSRFDGLACLVRRTLAFSWRSSSYPSSLRHAYHATFQFSRMINVLLIIYTILIVNSLIFGCIFKAKVNHLHISVGFCLRYSISNFLSIFLI